MSNWEPNKSLKLIEIDLALLVVFVVFVVLVVVVVVVVLEVAVETNVKS